MHAFRKLLNQENGQGLVEYTLILVLVAFALWVAVKDTTLAAALTTNWNTVSTCVSAPFACGSGS
jgi:Flp pilus assembly pilin Flp